LEIVPIGDLTQSLYGTVGQTGLEDFTFKRHNLDLKPLELQQRDALGVESVAKQL
jgi:hypothetical protein